MFLFGVVSSAEIYGMAAALEILQKIELVNPEGIEQGLDSAPQCRFQVCLDPLNYSRSALSGWQEITTSTGHTVIQVWKGDRYTGSHTRA